MSRGRALPSGREIEYDDRHGTYAVEWGDDEIDSIPYAIVELVAALEDRQPTEVVPLGEYVDTDALERLFEPSARNGHPVGTVKFEYAGYTVTVHDGRITASPISTIE
ncbi:HalOD1 output domain-containing protein [Salinirubrum litoreum]|uniref:HalOD1 output domain-containing protein n=1 Tax=Salinirubrum litoreum TaxID=1126234 RepID=A0ABD5RFY3_9EURY|nr:HalOD1 output domain-containing protein [Salinirubrum litoreum]